MLILHYSQQRQTLNQPNLGVMALKTPLKKTHAVMLAHIGALFTVTAWGSSFLSTKVLMNNGGFTPVEMYFYRFAAAYIILFLFTCRKLRSNSWRDEITLALSGICSGSLY